MTRHMGKFAQAQNLSPARGPLGILRFTIGTSHMGQSGTWSSCLAAEELIAGRPRPLRRECQACTGPLSNLCRRSSTSRTAIPAIIRTSIAREKRAGTSNSKTSFVISLRLAAYSVPRDPLSTSACPKPGRSRPRPRFFSFSLSAFRPSFTYGNSQSGSPDTFHYR